MLTTSLNTPILSKSCPVTRSFLNNLLTSHHKSQVFNISPLIHIDNHDLQDNFKEAYQEWKKITKSILPILPNVLLVNSHDYFYQFLGPNNNLLPKLVPSFERFSLSNNFIYFDPGEQAVIEHTDINYNKWLANSIYQCLYRKGTYYSIPDENHLDLKSRNAIINEIENRANLKLSILHI